MSTLRAAGWPSSSMADVPHSLRHGAVVDQRDQRAGHLLAHPAGEHRGALGRRGRPRARGRRPRGRARRRCPRRSPPAGRPTGAGRAASLTRARRAAVPGHLLGGCVVEQLEADGAGDRPRSPVCMPVSPRPPADGRAGCGPGRPRPGGRRCWRPGSGGGRRRRCADTWRTAPPADRAASSARVSSSTLAALATVSGRTPTAAGEPWRRRSRATVRASPPPPRAAAAPAAAAAASRPASDRSAVWAKPVVSPDHDPDARRPGRGRR